jgi:myo-inositol-1(or 4)-monophosphatase
MSSFMEICEKAARAGGAVLMEWLGRVQVQEKGRSDLVTEADFASQEMVRRTILEAFPDHTVLGEEAIPEASPAGSRASLYRWIVDPLDGTTNYVHQVPYFAVSLALEHAGELLVGIVYNPATGDCFSAEAGKGAYRNGVRLKTSQVDRLSQALCAVGFPAVVKKDSPDLRMMLASLEHCQSFRRTGSAALNLCYVAAGWYDAAWSFSTKIWDMAAGTLMIWEAGGIVTSPGSDQLCLDRGHYLAAANPALHKQLAALARESGVCTCDDV